MSSLQDPLVEDAVACSLLKSAADTRVARAYRQLREAGLVGPVLHRLAAVLGQATGARPSVQEAVAAARTALRRAAAEGLVPLVYGSADYPRRLATIVDPPIVLWSAGRQEALEPEAVALVGSRTAAAPSLLIARRLARDLAAGGRAIVSGLARGVDAASHQGALDVGGTTVGVLGCGVDVTYPREHRALSERIRAEGCLVSELPPGTPPLPHHFPLRNRVISGLASAVVVVEAAERSGSLITARAALDQGREVLAVPGSVVSGCHQGCHALIKDGAALVETADDVLAAMGWERYSVIQPKNKAGGVAGCMVPGVPMTIDALAAGAGQPVPAVLAELARLELDGVVARTVDGQFVRLD